MPPTLIIIPGLGDSGPQHWQTLWERKYGAVRLRQDDPEKPTPQAWSQRLDEVVAATPGDVVFVAHSCGVLTVVHWAARYPVPERVKGALLVAPPDTQQAGMSELAPAVLAMNPVPAAPLPFGALVVGSDNDPYCTLGRAEQLAGAWAAEFVSAGAAGHINVASGYGEWADGEVLLSEALHAWTPPDMVQM